MPVPRAALITTRTGLWTTVRRPLRATKIELMFDSLVRSAATAPDPSEVDDGELVELIGAWERLAAWAAAGQLAAIAELARRRPRDSPTGHRPPAARVPLAPRRGPPGRAGGERVRGGRGRRGVAVVPAGGGGPAAHGGGADPAAGDRGGLAGRGAGSAEGPGRGRRGGGARRLRPPARSRPGCCPGPAGRPSVSCGRRCPARCWRSTRRPPSPGMSVPWPAAR